MIRIKASDPGYEEINNLWNLYAIATNPHVWCNPVDMDDNEINTLRHDLIEYMDEALETPAEFIKYMLKINNEIYFIDTDNLEK